MKKNKEKSVTDFLKCILEIHEDNKINNHEHIYAFIERVGVDEHGEEFAEIKIKVRRLI